MKTIKTPRLELRPMCIDVLESLHEYTSDPVNTRFMVFLPNDTIDDTRKFIEDAQEEFKKDRPSYFEMAIFRDGTHIGSVSLYPDAAYNSAELGWILDPRYSGFGYATEAAKGLIDFAVNDLCIRHFCAHCDTENTASRKVMERLGMVMTSEHGGRKNKQSDEERREYLFEIRY